MPTPNRFLACIAEYGPKPAASPAPQVHLYATWAISGTDRAACGCFSSRTTRNLAEVSCGKCLVTSDKSLESGVSLERLSMEVA